MIPFNDLCASLDRFNRRRQGLPVPPPAPAASQAHQDEHAHLVGHDEGVIVDEHLAAGGEILSEEHLPAEGAMHVESTSPQRPGEESTSELDLDDLGELGDVTEMPE